MRLPVSVSEIVRQRRSRLRYRLSERIGAQCEPACCCVSGAASIGSSCGTRRNDRPRNDIPAVDHAPAPIGGFQRGPSFGCAADRPWSAPTDRDSSTILGGFRLREVTRSWSREQRQAWTRAGHKPDRLDGRREVRAEQREPIAWRIARSQAARPMQWGDASEPEREAIVATAEATDRSPLGFFWRASERTRLGAGGEAQPRRRAPRGGSRQLAGQRQDGKGRAAEERLSPASSA